jgi:hypothetical protein
VRVSFRRLYTAAPAGANVYFGTGSDFVAKEKVSGDVACWVTSFGADPAPDRFIDCFNYVPRPRVPLQFVDPDQSVL